MEIRYTNFIDMPGMKKSMEEMGSVLPASFTIELEKHLRFFARRFKPPKEKPQPKSTKEISGPARRFYFKPAIETEEYYVGYDEQFLRGWHKQYFESKPRSLTTIMPPDVDLDLKSAMLGLKRGEGVDIPVRQILDVIPRTRNRRKGQYAYVQIQIASKLDQGYALEYSSDTSKKPNTAYLPSFYGSDLMRVFDTSRDAVVRARIVSKRLLIYNKTHFLFCR